MLRVNDPPNSEHISHYFLLTSQRYSTQCKLTFPALQLIMAIFNLAKKSVSKEGERFYPIKIPTQKMFA